MSHKRKPWSASSPHQGNRAPWTARENPGPRTRSAATRGLSFSCISCVSWFEPLAALKHLSWLPFAYPRQHATTSPPHVTGPHLSVCGTTKYTKYTKTRAHKPKARDAASGVSCADVPRLTLMGHPAYKPGRPIPDLTCGVRSRMDPTKPRCLDATPSPCLGALLDRRLGVQHSVGAAWGESRALKKSLRGDQGPA